MEKIAYIVPSEAMILSTQKVLQKEIERGEVDVLTTDIFHPMACLLYTSGTGAQGPTLLEAALSVMKQIKKILVYNAHSFDRASAFADKVKQQLNITCDIAAVSDLEGACRQSDIILTATPCRDGLIQTDWIRPGTHLSCIGSDMEGKQELEETLLAKARVFCDDLAQVVAVGECEKAVKKGLLSPEAITEIGDVLLGKAPGRQSEDEITVFDSTGIGLQDLMVASVLTLSLIHIL